MAELSRFGVAMDTALLERFDELVGRRGSGANRSEVIRDLVRDALVDAEWDDASGEVVATVTMVFDHHASDLSEKLDSLQHAHHDKVISTLHVHLDAHNCLEVLVVKGPAADIRAISEALLGTKGVKHGGVVTTTTGDRL